MNNSTFKPRTLSTKIKHANDIKCEIVGYHFKVGSCHVGARIVLRMPTHCPLYNLGGLAAIL